MALCLVVEDEARQRATLSAALRSAGFEVVEASTAQAALDLARQHRAEVILLDLGLPDSDGMELIPQLLTVSPLSRLVVLTGRNSVAAAVDALRSGARHYLVKPWELEELLVIVEREARAVDLAESHQRSSKSEIFWGSHPEMTRIRAQLDKLAAHAFTPLLIEGETGTGKEVIARELHRLTSLSGSFVALNCASVPSELMESELFGHERGAFTGADTRRRGLAELARDGTLFLDEIGEMALPLQAKLLRFLQDFQFRRVGGEEELQSRCRIVAATHRDLDTLQEDESFRSDLFYRLAVVRMEIPPLRERREDILPLAYALLATVSEAMGSASRQLSPDAEQAILSHPWRGNVRELRNRIERALVLSEDEQIRPYDLDLGSGAFPALTSSRSDEAEKLRRLLEEEDWNVARAARRRGVPRHWLRYRMKKYGLDQK